MTPTRVGARVASYSLSRRPGRRRLGVLPRTRGKNPRDYRGVNDCMSSRLCTGVLSHLSDRVVVELAF